MFTLFNLLALLSVSTLSVATPVVSLAYGTFLGSHDGNLTKFLGVPFAEPAERFQLPKPPKQLRGLQNATAFGPACPQQKLSPPPFDFLTNYSSTSESCLTLDVFIPADVRPSAKLPVLVWFYGGFWQIGNSRNTDFRPAVEHSIALGEPVIIVASNYRLSGLGFLAGEEVSAAGITNLGMRDQILALEWVQKHISSFGGDPKRVVLGGASAGAISTGLLMLSNKRTTSELFRGAFMVSGSPLPSRSQADGQQYYDQIVAATNCTAAADTLDCLRSVPFDSLFASINQTPDYFSYKGLSLVWSPSVDGDIILQNPAVSVAQGAYAKIPLLTGDDDDEGTVFSFSSFNVTTENGFLQFLRDVYFPQATADQISRVAALYPQDPTQGSPFGTGTDNQLTPQYKRIAAFVGDFFFQAPRRAFLQHASKTQNTWSWLNKRDKLPSCGTFHTASMGLFFAPNIASPSDNVAVNALINFINTLDPNPPATSAAFPPNSTVFWPKYETPSADGSTSLLTFTDPLARNITADTYRTNAMQSITDLQLTGVTTGN
ncbi:carotenoid ester lipase precursor [Mycena crocata]|nr:carotenoid ester lipase precursor [Mycena crocata]